MELCPYPFELILVLALANNALPSSKPFITALDHLVWISENGEA